MRGERTAGSCFGHRRENMSSKSKSGFTYRAGMFLLLIFVTRLGQASELDAIPVSEDTLANSAVWQSSNLNSTGTLVTGKDKLFQIPLVGRITDIGIRMATVDGGQFDKLVQQSVFVDFELPWQWMPWQGTSVTPRLAFEFGQFKTSAEHRLFASLGPVFRFERETSRLPLFMELGFTPIVIDGSNYGESDLGTSLNFTSHVAFGLRFGRNKNNRVSLRYQHISNGGIDSTNPGVNMLGIDVVFWSR